TSSESADTRTAKPSARQSIRRPGRGAAGLALREDGRMAGGSEGVVLFDLDGVLVDSRVAVACCLNHALAVHGLPERPAEELHRFIGPPLSLAFGELIAQPPDSAAVADLVHTYRERYVDASLRDTEVVAGILEALVELEPNHRLAVATSEVATSWPLRAPTRSLTTPPTSPSRSPDCASPRAELVCQTSRFSADRQRPCRRRESPPADAIPVLVVRRALRRSGP
ncbi:MAG: phosphoglycolate phosphatase, partial [Solirubrobacteraceae bacterium]|nr:phosphoglycolate phosphatase [Solirubrobacteraceae bacterium]